MSNMLDKKIHYTPSYIGASFIDMTSYEFYSHLSHQSSFILFSPNCQCYNSHGSSVSFS